MFVQSEEFIAAHGGKLGDISIYGQESNYTTWRLAKMTSNLAVFEHTVEEVMQVLQYAEENLTNPKSVFHAMITSLRREGFSVADIVTTRGTLDGFFERYGIIRRSTPRYTKEFQIDEVILQKAIEEETHYPRQRALEKDINSIRSIYELRRDKRPYRLEDAVAILVTTNSLLAYGAYKYGQQHETSREVSTVITDFSLANVAWLKAPMASPDLPRLELIADCYATMEPSTKLWNRYIEEIDRLKERGGITPADHDVLKLSLIARDELMNLTLGSDKAFAFETVSEILERVKAELVREKDSQLQDERARRFETQSRVEALKDRQAAFQKRLDFFASRVGSIAQWGVFVILLVIISGGLFIASGFLGDQGSNSFWVVWVFRGLAVLSVVWGVVDAMWGLSIKRLAEKCGLWCERKTLTFLLQFFDIDSNQIKTSG